MVLGVVVVLVGFVELVGFVFVVVVGDEGASLGIVIILIMFLILFFCGLCYIFFILDEGVGVSSLALGDVIIANLALLVAHQSNLNI